MYSFFFTYYFVVVVTTISGYSAGYANGPANTASFNGPSYIAYNSFQNQLVVFDYDNNLIRLIYNPTPSSQPTQQPTSQPSRRPSRRPSTQPTDRPTGYRGVEVYTLAGGGSTGTSSGSTDGTGTNSLFNGPMGGSVNPSTGDLYVADYSNNCIRVVSSQGYNI